MRYGDASTEVVADHEGYFSAVLPGPGAADTDPQWRVATTELLSPPGLGGTGRVLVPDPGARFGVVSDLDDTVIQTGVRRVLHLLSATFLENARTRLPFPGVAAFYQALRAEGPGIPPNPIFYVSSSPWNFHDFLLEFLEVRGIPVGPLLLRDWGTARFPPSTRSPRAQDGIHRARLQDVPVALVPAHRGQRAAGPGDLPRACGAASGQGHGDLHPRRLREPDPVRRSGEAGR